MYELMYIINPVLNEEQTADIVKRVDAYLKENEATIDNTNVQGSQRLAYPIEKKRNGYYVIVNFSAPGEFIARLDRALRINDDIMRHLLLRYDAKMARHYEAMKTGDAPKMPTRTESA
ncbi:30S ribosomal protein S6 [Rubricoccus marinus]|uniref:Small ribosomal subunit protein bS6 n=2 Tax=Rubricoccus marinus TaxID=716817 RepID=A0A259U3Z1_9BACT|nr:30S ribosomal protein S6 [Rubricoccus marinus]